jgi:hypothetical protein
MFGRSKRRRPQRRARPDDELDIPIDYDPGMSTGPRPARRQGSEEAGVDQYMYRSIMSMLDEPAGKASSPSNASMPTDGFEKSGTDSLSLRIEIPNARAEQLRALARELDESPQSLARLWVMERLRELSSRPSTPHTVTEQGSNGGSEHTPAAAIPQLPGAAKAADPAARLAAIKAEFRNAYVTDPNEQVIYDETYTFRQWGPYIAAIVLTAKGRKNFTLDDILQVLRDELIPDLYDTPTIPEKNITLRDVELGRPGDPFRPYACLERISAGVYSYMGFSKARALRAGR